MKIGVIGTGTIASAVVEALVSGTHEIAVSERNATNAARLAAHYSNVTVATNADVIAQSDVVFLGLMAEVTADVLGALTFRPDQQVISLMAGPSLDEVASLVAPAHLEAIMIPFPAIATGGSAILVRGGTKLVEKLFAPQNEIFPLASDRDLTAYLCAQAVLSPSVKLVAEAADWLGKQTADQAQGEAFLRFLVGSSLQGTACAPLLKALDTPGGYNQRLLQYMEKGGFTAPLAGGLDALKDGA